MQSTQGSVSLHLGERPVAVFSHPNHELVILGMVHALDCPVIYLTDGGVQRRAASTREGLKRVGHGGPLVFLSRAEQSAYDALLHGDRFFFDAIAEDLAKRFRDLRADCVLTVPVEFYNPVHDLTASIVWRAFSLANLRLPVYEAPLIYQKGESNGAESYVINRFPSSQVSLIYEVPEYIVDAKLSLFQEVYHDLTAQLGALVSQMPREWFATEHYRPGSVRLEEPSRDRALRYERRGGLLRRSGAVHDIITYRDHFLPIATHLVSKQLLP